MGIVTQKGCTVDIDGQRYLLEGSKFAKCSEWSCKRTDGNWKQLKSRKIPTLHSDYAAGTWRKWPGDNHLNGKESETTWWSFYDLGEKGEEWHQHSRRPAT